MIRNKENNFKLDNENFELKLIEQNKNIGSTEK